MIHKANLKLHDLDRIVGSISLTLLIILLLVLLSPTVTNNTSALNPPAWTSYPASIAIALDEVVELNVTPTASGSTGAASSKVKVKTTDASSYAIYLNTLSTSTAMQNVDSTKLDAIHSTPSSATLASLEPNTWGYSINSTTSGTEAEYHPVSEASTLVYSSTKSEEDLELSFGAKLDTSLPAGQYANTIAVSAVASPLQVQGLLGINYMQDMTSDICKATAEHDTKQLIDSRDGKEYWVAKLADGNCWMTQNLAYDLVKGKVLTPSDTDVTSNWIIPTTTEDKVPEKETTPSDFTARSWRLGEYVWATPTHLAMCQYVSNSNDSVRAGDTLDRCDGFQKVEGWRSTFATQEGVWNGVKYDAVAVDKDAQTYDAHYLIGNYYQWLAATAESGKALFKGENTVITNINNSICPKGWKLPAARRDVSAAGSQPHDLDDSFYRLLAAYGYPKRGGYQLTGNGDNVFTPLLNGKDQNVFLAPMYEVAGGHIRLDKGALSVAGYIGNVQSSYVWTYYKGQYSNLVFSFSSNLYPATNVPVSDGISVRCVAK